MMRRFGWITCWALVPSALAHGPAFSRMWSLPSPGGLVATQATASADREVTSAPADAAPRDPAAAAGNVCWYSRVLTRDPRRCECELTEHDCEPDVQLPCETQYDCKERFRETGNCDFKKGCIADNTLCGCGPVEVSACCLPDQSCENLLFPDCEARGGNAHAGELCGDFTCPAPAACCVNDRKCEELTEANCSRVNGVWSAEQSCGDKPCPCHDVRQISGRCKGDGTIRAVVKFRNDDWDGRTIAVGIEGDTWFELDVAGHIARRSICCFDGEQTLVVRNPACGNKKAVVSCP